MKRIRITISGEVQGVFFRKNAQAKATSLGLAGWVKNTEGGRVLAEVEGEPHGVEQFLQWCRQGPVQARVSRVDTKVVPSRNEKGFRILY